MARQLVGIRACVNPQLRARVAPPCPCLHDGRMLPGPCLLLSLSPTPPRVTSILSSALQPVTALP